MSAPPVTCHVLDTTRGKPAVQVKCEISYLSSSTLATPNDEAKPFAQAYTNQDGRVPKWEPSSSQNLSALGFENGNWVNLVSGTYRIRFHTKEYFAARDGNTFFPFVDINFEIPNPPDHHYHVPLLLSNYGYSTYRGS